MIWQPILCRFRNWDNPGKLSEGTIFEFVMCKFKVLQKIVFIMWIANIGAAMMIQMSSSLVNQ